MPSKIGPERGGKMDFSPDKVSEQKSPKQEQLSEEESSSIVEIARYRKQRELEALEAYKEKIRNETGSSPADIFKKIIKGEMVPLDIQIMVSQYYYERAYSLSCYEGDLKRAGKMTRAKGEDETGIRIGAAIGDLKKELGKARKEADDKETLHSARKKIDKLNIR